MVHIEYMPYTINNKSCNNFKHLDPRNALIEFSKCYSYTIISDVEWREIPGFRQYLVSNSGQVKNTKSYAGRTRMLVPTLRFNTYFYVTLLSNEGKRVGVAVDKLVALAFIDNCIGKYERIQHIDNIRYNNRKENLKVKI